MVKLMDDGDEYDCDGGDCSKLRRWTVVKDGMNDGSDDGDKNSFGHLPTSPALRTPVHRR